MAGLQGLPRGAWGWMQPLPSNVYQPELPVHHLPLTASHRSIVLFFACLMNPFYHRITTNASPWLQGEFLLSNSLAPSRLAC